MTPTIVCAVKPSPVVRTLLEVYYRFMGYRIAYVCPKEDVLSWISDGTHLPPGMWYSTEREAFDRIEGQIAFALVEDTLTALFWHQYDVPTFEPGGQ